MHVEENERRRTKVIYPQIKVTQNVNDLTKRYQN